MKKIFLFIITCFFFFNLKAQSLSKQNLQQLKKVEDSLKIHSKKMIFDTEAINRFRADSFFIRAFVRALKIKNSFNYTFDSIQTVSKIYSPDSLFRIFTWQFMKDEATYRQRGAIQVRTTDGSLKLFPLFDVSEYTNAATDSVRTPNNWIGAIYYGIILKTYNSKKYYTLLGYDDNSARTNKKWIEILTFSESGIPHFGKNIFVYKKDGLKANQPAYRFVMEYKKDARARLIYDIDEDMIVFDHLISEEADVSKRYTLIPAGDYEGFKWKDGQWIHVEKIHTQILKDGQAPIPFPIKDASGKSDEEKLKQQSLKNAKKNNGNQNDQREY